MSIESGPRPSFSSDSNPDKESIEPVSQERIKPETQIEHHYGAVENIEAKTAEAIESKPMPEPTPEPSVIQESLSSRPIPNAEQRMEYVARYYPNEGHGTVSDIAYRAYQRFCHFMHLGKKTEGKEHVPTESPFLIIAPHEGGETPHLVAAFDQPIRIMGGRESNFKRRSWFANTFMQMIKVIPIQESLAHLDTAHQQKAIDATTTPEERAAYVNIQKDWGGLRGANDIRAAVACLINNEPVLIYPQGLWIRGTKNRIAQGGYALIAREYEKQTGRQLPIVPVNVTDGNVAVREAFTLPSHRRESGESQSLFYGRIAMEKISDVATSES